MKSTLRYFKNREKIIIRILKKPKEKYSPETFHQLRVEIKKLHAFLDLLKFCSKDFNKKAIFKPLQLIFYQAGLVRELQIEATILNKYFLNNQPKDYKINLKNIQANEKEKFFSITTKTFIKGLKKKLSEVERFIHQVKKKSAESYLAKKEKKIEKLFGRKTLQTSQLHFLRKQLKKLMFNKKALGLIKQNEFSCKEDILPELLGKWNDRQIIINHLKKNMKASKIRSKEWDTFKKVIEGITTERDLIRKQINETISNVIIKKYSKTLFFN